MAHCIDTIKLPEVETPINMFAGNGEGGWHDLGDSRKVFTMQELAKNAGMVYHVNKVPALDVQADGTVVEIPNQFHLKRDIDQRIVSESTVTKSYHPYDYKEVLELLQILVDKGYARPETCMVLKNGSVEVCTIRWNQPEATIEDPHSKFEQYFVLSNHHDKKGGVVGIPTCVRVVCMNTYMMALSGGVQFKIKHTANVSERVAQAMNMMESSSKAVLAFNEHYRKMAETNISIPDSVDALLGIGKGDEVSTRMRNKRDSLVIASNMPSKGTFGKTAADFFNGVTYDLSHNSTGKNAGTRIERFESRLLGARGDIEAKAWRIALDCVA